MVFRVPRSMAPAVAALLIGWTSQAMAQPAEPAVDAVPASEAAAQVAYWVRMSGDNQGLPFAIVDKTAAEVFVFGSGGELIAATPALVGEATGDESTPGIGDRELSDIAPEERTTPAGRFLASYGPATGGRKVLWVDYGTAISLHPVVTTNPKERRLQRLKSPSADDNRITYGCINVPTKFYRTVVQPVFKEAGGVVYILPDSKPLAEVFPGLVLTQAKAGGGSADGALGMESAAAW